MQLQHLVRRSDDHVVTPREHLQAKFQVSQREQAQTSGSFSWAGRQEGSWQQRSHKTSPEQDQDQDQDQELMGQVD